MCLALVAISGISTRDDIFENNCAPLIRRTAEFSSATGSESPFAHSFTSHVSRSPCLCQRQSMSDLGVPTFVYAYRTTVYILTI